MSAATRLAATQRRFRRQAQHTGQAITIAGTAYPCVRTTVSIDRLFLPAGRLDMYAFSVRIPMAEGWTEATLPAADTLATFAGTEYRILATEIDGPGASWLAHIGSKHAVARR